MSSASTTARAKTLRRLATGSVVLVPLAFAGLFVSALPETDDSLDRIPAAIVNEDQLVYQEGPDGERVPVFAGRQLVTELTGDRHGFDWSITNRAAADEALASGKVYAVLTIPDDFSSSILSLSSDEPSAAELSIRTDDSHNYLTGAVAETIGSAMATALGNEITAQYISGIYSNLGDLGTSLGEAAGGAGALADGITEYTAGVDELSEGLAELSGGADALVGLGTGVGQFTAGTTGLAQALAAASRELQASPGNAISVAKVNAISAQLSALAARGPALAEQATSGIAGIQQGVATSAAGAAVLAESSGDLRSGAEELAAGLSAGADRMPAGDPGEPGTASRSAQVASDPVQLTVTRDNEVSGVGEVISTFFVPLGLWIGALALFLVLRPASGRALGSTVGDARLVFAALGRAVSIAAAQAVLLAGLMHIVVGVPWSALAGTLGFSLLMASVFTAFHYLLTIAFGRAGLVVSLFALAVQLTSTGGLYPVQVLAEPFQWLSPLLPLTYGVSGMQAMIASGATSSVASTVALASVALLAFGLGSVLVSLLVIRRTRRASNLVLVTSAS